MQRRKTGRRHAGTPSRPPARVVFDRRRQVLLAVLAVVGLATGFAIASLLDSGSKDAVEADMQFDGRNRPASPWYKTQPPPPSLVAIPDAPILPEANGDHGAGGRAYEEALPADLYEAPPVAVAPPPPVPAAASQRPAVRAEVPPEAAGPAEDVPPSGPPAWQQFALAAPETHGQPVVAIVIDDLGLDRKRSTLATELPGPLTLSYLTYADDLDRQTRAARKAGHELMLHVGMEPTSRNIDPGPNVLLTTDGPDEIRRRLRWGLDRFTGYVGVNNHMGSRFTESPEAMAVVMDELKQRGLLFLDSRTSPHSVGARLAREWGVPAAARNVFLDNENDVAKVQAQLAEVERIARRTGAAVAIGHPRDATLTALAEWIPALERKGLVLVPLSAVVRAATKTGGAG